MNRKVLCVDDEPNVLEAYRRSLRAAFDIDIASGGTEALQTIDSRGPYAVVVCDMRMPEMNGIEVLEAVKQRAPDTVRMMLTGNADQRTAIDAVNRGEIFRFLNKPCPTEDLARSLEAGVTQHRLVTAEMELLHKTLRGSIQILTEVLSLVNPAAFGRTARVTRTVRQIARTMDLDDTWRVETAALLSQIGCVILPESLLEKVSGGRPLTDEESQLFLQHPSVGAKLLAKIPRLEEITEAVQCQDNNFDGSGALHDERAGTDIPLGARLLKVALDIDRHETAGLDRTHAIAHLTRRAHRYDPEILAALVRSTGDAPPGRIVEMRLADLSVGMVLAADVMSTRGLLVVSKGHEVTSVVRERLTSFGRNGQLVEPIRVVTPDAGKAPAERARVA